MECLANNDQEAVPMFAIDESGVLYWFTADDELEPKEGWKVYALSVPGEAMRRRAED